MLSLTRSASEISLSEHTNNSWGLSEFSHGGYPGVLSSANGSARDEMPCTVEADAQLAELFFPPGFFSATEEHPSHGGYPDSAAPGLSTSFVKSEPVRSSFGGNPEPMGLVKTERCVPDCEHARRLVARGLLS